METSATMKVDGGLIECYVSDRPPKWSTVPPRDGKALKVFVRRGRELLGSFYRYREYRNRMEHIRTHRRPRGRKRPY